MWSTSALRGQGRGAGVFGRGRSESLPVPVGASASLSAIGDRVQNIYNQELLPHRLLFWLRLPSRSQSHSRPSVQRLACAHGHGGPDHGHGHGPELGVLNYSL